MCLESTVLRSKVWQSTKHVLNDMQTLQLHKQLWQGAQKNAEEHFWMFCPVY